MGFVKLEHATRKRLSGQATAAMRIGYAPAAGHQPEAIRVMIDREQIGAASAWLLPDRRVDVEIDAAQRLLRVARGSSFRVIKGSSSSHMVFVRLPVFGAPTARDVKRQSDVSWRYDCERLVLTIPSWLVIGDAAADEPVETAVVPAPESVAAATADAPRRAKSGAPYRMGIPTPKDDRERIERSIASRRVLT